MVSVIIPTLNEAGVIESSIRSLLDHQGDFEVIVVDGGSSDGTLHLLNRFPQVKVVQSFGRGRGRQMNEGAGMARGDILLFLHADTRLPPSAFAAINEAMGDSSVVGGCFCLDFEGRSFLLRLYSRFSRINSVFFTYGDQGLFLRRDTFKVIRGFKDIPLMEDLDIQTRLRSMGRFVKLCDPVTTSARRFVRRGIARQEILNMALVFFYLLGVSPFLLKHFYRDSPEHAR